MAVFVLVIFIYAGTLAQGDNVAVTPIYGFRTQQECEAAGRASEKLVTATQKSLRFVCLRAEGRR